MKRKATGKTDAAITYRISRDQLEEIRKYCFERRISIQHFIHEGVLTFAKKIGIKLP
jgi:hypothetical protein